jgi:hypothetical protein
MVRSCQDGDRDFSCTVGPLLVYAGDMQINNTNFAALNATLSGLGEKCDRGCLLLCECRLLCNEPLSVAKPHELVFGSH